MGNFEGKNVNGWKCCHFHLRELLTQVVGSVLVALSLRGGHEIWLLCIMLRKPARYGIWLIRIFMFPFILAARLRILCPLHVATPSDAARS